MDLFAAAIIESSKEFIVVPMKWIQCINLFDALKSGVNCAQTIIVFHSLDKQANPNFELPPSQQFRETDSCYLVRILKFFGKKCVFIINNMLIVYLLCVV